eukprot:6176529-Pleurochrysis_carterae.AAC.6
MYSVTAADRNISHRTNRYGLWRFYRVNKYGASTGLSPPGALLPSRGRHDGGPPRLPGPPSLAWRSRAAVTFTAQLGHIYPMKH